jgi:hypothetical protein
VPSSVRHPEDHRFSKMLITLLKQAPQICYHLVTFDRIPQIQAWASDSMQVTLPFVAYSVEARKGYRIANIDGFHWCREERTFKKIWFGLQIMDLKVRNMQQLEIDCACPVKGAHEKQTRFLKLCLLSTCEFVVQFCVQLHCVLYDLSEKKNEHCTSENVYCLDHLLW